MWLLSTDRAELHCFSRNFDADGGYAILSHTWGELSPKICECCILAGKHGYRWVWIDSCCIDKTSSSELSEAINSMYKWYQSSEVCHAYLKDVPTDDEIHADDSAFRKSRWHTRGWTLQELIAPDVVIFLSVDWVELGDRADLAGLLQEIAWIPFGILTGEDRPAEYGASNRMSWASRRKTTRVEDEAYCLMGLFGVSMPTNYGEGKMAFVRLQNEIMQHILDMTLFTFGECIDMDEIVRNGVIFESHGKVDLGNPWQYLLADSPRPFGNTFGYIPYLGWNAKQQYPPPDSTTPSPFNATVDGVTIAVMLCEASDRHFGLFLTRDRSGQDPVRPRYFTGQSYTQSTTGSVNFLARMCDLGDDLYNLTFNGKPVKASWSTIYIVPTASHIHSESVSSPTLTVNCNSASRFHVPRWLVDRFTALQFDIRQIKPPDSQALQVLIFNHRTFRGGIFLIMGMCTNLDKSPHTWAKVVVMALVNLGNYTHDCSMDHLDADSWATGSKIIGDEDRKVRLSVTPSKRMPETTLVVHLELFGRVFEEMLQETGISFPSLADLERDSSRPIPGVPLFLATGFYHRTPYLVRSDPSFVPLEAQTPYHSHPGKQQPSPIGEATIEKDGWGTSGWIIWTGRTFKARGCRPYTVRTMADNQ
ncbi:hypothetical protein V8D89_009005 [Ganoderma adspersum]